MDKWIRNPGWTWVQKAFLIAFLDGIIILAAYLMALLLRFDFIFSRISRFKQDAIAYSLPDNITPPQQEVQPPDCFCVLSA